MSLAADYDGRTGLMKMQLSNPLISVQTNTTPNLLLAGDFNDLLSGFPSPMSEIAPDELIPSFANFIHDLSSFSFEDTVSANTIAMEHSYSRAWNWRPETNTFKPARNLLVHRPPACPGCHEESEDPYIDVDGPLSPPPPLPYDVEKGRLSMNEIENKVEYITKSEDDEWEDKIDRKHWSANERAYFERLKTILNDDLVARLTVHNNRNEPVLRRSIVDRSVLKFRRAFSTIGWDMKILQGMHNVFIDHLNKRLLSVYIDILQGLKSKLPVLVDKLMFSSIFRNGACYEGLVDLLKKPWNPLDDNIINSKTKKIPNNPIFFVCPSCPQVNSMLPSRYQQLMSFLSAIATVENVSLNLGFSSSRFTLTQVVEHMLATSRTRLQEVKSENPDRPIILIGFHSGASLAFQIAQTEMVTCIVCIGFDIHTAEGMRGTPDDIILNIPCPILFIMGENSARSHPEEIENLRENMSAETSLIIIGSADDSLRLSCNKKIYEGVTQPMVDRCIIDEIADYVTSILLNPYPDATKQRTSYITNYKQSSIKKQFRTKKISKRRFSSGSYCDNDLKFEPHPKRVRPVGRPRGSSSKNKINLQMDSTLHYSNLGNITVSSLDESPANCNKVNYNRQNNHVKHRNALNEFNEMQQQDVIDRAVMSILPEISDDSQTPRKVLTPMNDTLARNESSLVITDPNHPPRIKTFDSSKYKLSTYNASSNSNKLVLSANNLSQRFKGNAKLVKMYLPQSSNVSKPGKSSNALSTKPSNDQLAGTNILDIPIVFADNDGYINEPLKVEDNTSPQVSTTKVNKKPIKMIVLNKSSKPHLHNFSLNSDTKLSASQKSSANNNSDNKYPKILFRQSPVQNSVRLTTTQSQQSVSSSIDFKNVDLESKLVANKVLKTIPPAVKQITPIGESVSPANSDIKNKILLTVGSRMSVYKSGDKDNNDKTTVKSPIIFRPGTQIKAIPMLQAQNILNRNFSIKKNPKCNFSPGQKVTLQQISSKDNSDA